MSKFNGNQVVCECMGGGVRGFTRGVMYGDRRATQGLNTGVRGPERGVVKSGSKGVGEPSQGLRDSEGPVRV